MKRRDITPQMLKLMNPATLAELGISLTSSSKTSESSPVRHTGALERQHQRVVANFCLLKGLPFVWHATNKPSTATRGTPDFIIGLSRETLWLELKQPGEKLSDDQEAFRVRLESQGIRLRVWVSCCEINTTNQR